MKEKLADIRMQIYDMAAWLKKPAKWLLICILIAMIPLLQADFHYRDDLGRAAIGYRLWADFSRYVSEYGSVVLHAGKYLTDISPIPQLLAAVVMAVCCAVVIRSFKRDRNEQATLWEVIAVLPLALSPYFMECLSYQYDSPYMALSVLFSVAPFVLPVWSGAAYCIASACCTLMMCISYQAASGIYPMLVVFLAVRKWNEAKRGEAVRFAVQSALSYAAGLAVFALVLMPKVDSYVQTSMLPAAQMLPGFFENLAAFWRMVISDFKKAWLGLVGLVLACYVLSSAWRAKGNRLLAGVVAAAGLAMAAVLAFGVYPALSAPLIEPRAMFGAGALIAFAGVSACGGKRAPLARVSCLALSWCFFVFALTYGNALAEQKRYAQMRTELVLSDLNDLPVMNNGQIKVVTISGDIGLAPVVEKIPDNQGVLNKMIPTLFSEEPWGENGLYCYEGMKDVVMLEDASFILDQQDITQLDLPVVKDTMYHTIRSNGQYVVIDLK